MIYGSIGIAYAVGELAVFILTVSLCCAEDNQIFDNEEIGDYELGEDPYNTENLEKEIEEDVDIQAAQNPENQQIGNSTALDNSIDIHKQVDDSIDMIKRPSKVEGMEIEANEINDGYNRVLNVSNSPNSPENNSHLRDNKLEGENKENNNKDFQSFDIELINK